MKATKARGDDLKGKGALRRRTAVILAAFVVVLIVIITAVTIYGSKMAPFRATVLEVNDTSIKTRYFLKRASMSSGSPEAVLQTLVNEQIINQTAPHPPYSIRVTEKDVQLFLREMARDELKTISDDEFEVWYRQQLDETRFSDVEYKDLVRRGLLRQRLTIYLAERIPTVLEQVHLFMIAQRTAEDVLKVKKRLDAGEDFFKLARQLNLDEELKAKDGNLGWYPRDALPENVARVAFDELDVGRYSEPLVVNQQFSTIVMVSERAATRQIDEKVLQILKSNVLERWLQEELPHHKVVIHGLNNGYDGETDAWVQWQLLKMRK